MVSSKPSSATLTFEDRVGYQRAIEEVYQRHRIWPKEASIPKPFLDAVMSRAQLEKKVANYLRNSQALDHYWQTPVTAEQLQAEMDRMAKQTKQADVLRELFEALGNDPFVIAECLARPALTDRMVSDRYAFDERIHGPLKRRAEADLAMRAGTEQMKNTSGTYSEVSFVRGNGREERAQSGTEHRIELNNREWDETVQKLAATFNSSKNGMSKDFGNIPVGELSDLQDDQANYYSIAVIQKDAGRLKLATITWPKETLDSWRARVEKQLSAAVVAPRRRYTLPEILGATSGCSPDSWAATTLNLPTPRDAHTAIWTGSEMIIWGGGFGAPSTPTNTGGRYNPSTDAWTTTSTINAPSARGGHCAVWTGSEMIVWGGGWMNSGGRYNPTTDSWAPLSTTNAPSGRSGHSGVWTGAEMIVWGGTDSTGNLNSGGRYNPSTNSWKATSTANAPTARSWHSTVWTGSQMIVWGGYVYNNINQNLNTGGRYDPSTNSWTATSTTNAPIARENHTAVWTGNQMIVWGGINFSDPGNPGPFNTGGRYDAGTNSWTATSTTNAPAPRYYHTAIWTGTAMIVWGGETPDGFVNAGARFDPGTNSWTSTTSTTNAPPRRWRHSAIWTGNEMIVWGGDGDSSSGALNTGGQYNPSTDTWMPTQPPTGRIYYTAVWTGSEMIVWGGFNGYFGLNTGGRYNPATDTWVATSTDFAPTGRYYHTAVWTGSEMIVWGGFDNNCSVNTGGKYDPDTDRWTNTSTANAPSARSFPTAVWTGTKMIVWGGYDCSANIFNTGGNYDPSADTWVATSTINAPTARSQHTAVWTGSEMIVWGGSPDAPFQTAINTGARYNPGSDSWASTSMTNAPSARLFHTATWTGSEMIVWGGGDGNGNLLDTGGRYNPGSNNWTVTSTMNAPSVRADQTVVWTGTEMIVWGGFDNGPAFYLNTGGRYNPATDDWVATSTTDNAPIGRWGHRAVWTGSEMIVWGGINGGLGDLNNGGRYCDATAVGGSLGNISTRLRVGTGDNVLIGGFIIEGTEPKKVIVRALGPTLGQSPYNVPGTLGNPTLELHDTNAMIARNDNWQTSQLGGIITADQSGEIARSNYAPPNSAESAIIATLSPGNYTAVVRGVNNTTGVALVEVYDLSNTSSSQLKNASTRGFVGTDSDVMIGGVIVITQPTTVLLRALGPTLGQAPFNVSGAMANPQLELHDATATVARNDNWQTTQIGGLIASDQVSQIQATGYAPPNTSEPAILVTLQPGSYTAILRGVGSTTGVALVEVYRLQ